MTAKSSTLASERAAHDLTEIRWHARGGQGAVTAAKMVAELALGQGKHFQAFPEYGPERSGAPIQSSARTAKAQGLTASTAAAPIRTGKVTFLSTFSFTGVSERRLKGLSISFLRAFLTASSICL